MPLAPNAVEQLLFLTTNQAPGVTLDLWAGPAFRLVVAGIRLNVFETLAQTGPCTVEALAQKINANLRGTRILLRALESLGYVEADFEEYSISSMTHKWLTSTGDINFSAYFLFWGAVLEKLWPQLEQSFRTGQPPVNLYEWFEEEQEVSAYFQEGMIAIAKYVAPDMAKAIHLPDGATRLLDIGGGHATYSIALCQRYPQLSAVVFDTPEALVTGRENIRIQGMQDRVSVEKGNFITDDLGKGYDVALVFNIVHGLHVDQNITLFRKVAQALNPGGMIIIAEQLPDSSMLPIFKPITQILSASYFHLLGGQIYTYSEITNWLVQTGFHDPHRTNLMRAGSSLISATKP